MVIIIKQYGQLGNRLFPFAQFIAHAKKHNYRLLNPAFEDYSEYFQNTEKSLLSSYPKGIQSRFFTKRVRRIAFRFIEKGVNFAIRKKLLKSWFHEIIIGETSKHFHSDEKLIKKFKRKFVFVCNPFYFRDEVTMHKDIEYVTQFLSIKEEYKKKVDNLIKIAKSDCDILIGMHIRGGDFRYWLDGMYFYDIHNFQEAMKQATKVFEGKKVAFLICSNETWEESLFEGYKVFFGPGQIVEDIYSLSQTDYLVAGYSSYAWWASITGNVPIYSFLHHKIFEKEMELEHFIDIKTLGSIP